MRYELLKLAVDACAKMYKVNSELIDHIILKTEFTTDELLEFREMSKMCLEDLQVLRRISERYLE